MTAPTRHPDPSKERAAAALRAARRGGPRIHSAPRRRPLRARVRSWLKYRARYALASPVVYGRAYARRQLRQLRQAWDEYVCRTRGHDDRHPAIVGEMTCPPSRACLYCSRCGRTEHDVAPPLPLRPLPPSDRRDLAAERDWLRRRFYYATPDRSRLNRAEAYVEQLAATYGLDALNAHRLARQRITAGEWTP